MCRPYCVNPLVAKQVVAILDQCLAAGLIQLVGGHPEEKGRDTYVYHC